MNNKKSFLSRMTRRKSSTPAEPEEGAYEIPPPSAIGRMPSDSSRRAESMESGYGLDLELLASDKPPRPDSANGMNAQESGHAPALESSPAPVSDESPDAPKPPRALEVHQEYGLELEVLAASESDESPDAPEPLEEHEEAASAMAESAVEAPAPDTEAIGDSAPAHEESLAEPVSDEPPDEAESFQEDEVSSSIPVAPDLPLEQPDESLANLPHGKRILPSRKRCAWSLAARQGVQPERVARSGPEYRRGRASAYPRRQAPPQCAPDERRHPRKSEKRRLKWNGWRVGRLLVTSGFMETE